MVEAQHVSKFVHDDCPHFSRTVRAAGGDSGKIRGVEAYLARGEDQWHQWLPGSLRVTASAESGHVSGKAGSFRGSGPGDQNGRPAFPVAVRLECLPVIAGCLRRGSVVHKLQTRCLRRCCHGFPDQEVSTCRRLSGRTT